jgi:hypothetical protein
VKPEALAEIKERLTLLNAAVPGVSDTGRWFLPYEAYEARETLAYDDVPALVAEVERARRLLLWLSSAYLDTLTSLRDEGCEPTQWGKHREMERIAITIAESAPTGEPFTPE